MRSITGIYRRLPHSCLPYINSSMNAYICTAFSFDLDIVFSLVLVLYHVNEQPWERPGNERREREKKIDEEITRIKKYFNVAIKINFVCCILIWCTLCLVSFQKQWNTRKKRARGERIRVVWRCLYRLSFGVASNESTESAESDCSQWNVQRFVKIS